MKSARQGATLAEVALGSLLFSVFSLAVLGLWVRTYQLNQQDQELSQIYGLSEGLMEEIVGLGSYHLQSQPLRASPDSAFLYAIDVSPQEPGLKKVVLLLYYRDPQGGTLQVDRSRGRQGLANSLGTALDP